MRKLIGRLIVELTEQLTILFVGCFVFVDRRLSLFFHCFDVRLGGTQYVLVEKFVVILAKLELIEVQMKSCVYGGRMFGE